MDEIKKFRKTNMPGEYICSYSKILNPHDNGGEQVDIEVDVYKEQGEKPFTNMTINTHCYGTHKTSISFYGTIDINTIINALTSIKERIYE